MPWRSVAPAAYRSQREESWLMRSIRKAYYRIVSRLSGIEIPIDVGEFQLIERKVLAALLQHDDHYPYIRGMIANCGFGIIGEYVSSIHAQVRKRPLVVERETINL